MGMVDELKVLFVPDYVLYAIGIILCMICYLVGYTAGQNDGHREERCQQHARTDAPIPMEHAHGGEDDGDL